MAIATEHCARVDAGGELLSTVSRVEGFEKVKAEQDADQDVHYRRLGSTGSTLCGMKAAAPATGDVTCYRCHEFSRGNV